MFPFTLSGPPFLGFYAVLALLMLAAYWYWASAAEDPDGSSSLTDLTADPYKIAYLRGGEEETVRLALINLVDRGLLQNRGTTISATLKAHEEFLGRPLDRAILAHCKAPSVPQALLEAAAVRSACGAYKDELMRKGLLPSDNRRSAVFAGLVVVLGLLGGLAVVRILMSLARGHSNVLFLIVLAAAACWAAYRIYSRRSTPAGRRALASLETLMQRLKARAHTLGKGGATNEALLVAAVFGIHQLPGGGFPFIEQMFPRPRKSNSRDGSSSCSSSSGCSSASTDSGSSDSGGAGCGGGGGGCGGGGD